MRKLILMMLVALCSLSAYAQPSAGYYTNAQGKTGSALKSALHNIIDGHQEYPYSSSSTDVWDILKVADRDPNNSSNVIGFYSRFSMNAAAEYNSGNGWNREHVWAKSRGDFGTSQGAGTDLHHLRAADISTNSARNNRNFGDGGSTYVDGSGQYNGTTPCKTNSTNYSWEPGDAQKGDVARMIFYMAVRYEGDSGEPDLELTESYLSSSDKSPYHGKLSTLLEWHAADPVSQEEVNRNNIIESYQGNRNPFIDEPTWVNDIWGGSYPGDGGGSGGGGGSCYSSALTLELTTDNYGSETSWTIKNSSGTTVKSGSGYGNNSTQTINIGSLSNGDYTFTINDSYGDGICCSYGNGSYALKSGSSTIKSGGSFGSSESTNFCISGSSGGGGSTGQAGTLTLVTDNYGSETSWTLKNSSGTTVKSGSGYSSNRTYTVDLGTLNGSYTFTINDSYGDGICCSYGNGSYSISVGGSVKASGGSFGSTESKSFCAGSGCRTAGDHLATIKHEPLGEAITLFPVPARNSLNIQLSRVGEGGTAQVLNLSGAVLAEQPATNEMTFDVSGLAKGVYLVRVFTGKEIVAKRFVKQ